MAVIEEQVFILMVPKVGEQVVEEITFLLRHFAQLPLRSILDEIRIDLERHGQAHNGHPESVFPGQDSKAVQLFPDRAP